MIHQIAIPVNDTTVNLHLFRLGEYFLFMSPANAYFIFLDLFYTPVINSRSVSLRFCRHVQAMSSASSNQLVVREGTDYEEVYPFGHKDQESPGEEKSPSTSSSSSTNEDMEMAESEDISDDSEDQPLRSVVGADGLREFILLPKWTVYKFTSVIKEKHFNTFRANFQIPDNIPIRLPCISKKCYYKGVEGVGVYEHMLKVGLRFPLSTLHRELLK